MDKKDKDYFDVNQFLRRDFDKDQTVDDINRHIYAWMQFGEKTSLFMNGGTGYVDKPEPEYVGLHMEANVRGNKRIPAFRHVWHIDQGTKVDDMSDIVDLQALVKNMIALDHVVSTMPRFKKDSFKLHQATLLRENLEAIIRMDKPMIAPELVLGVRNFQMAVQAAVEHAHYAEARDRVADASCNEL